MSGHRKILRDAVRGALASDPRIGAYLAVKAWSRPVGQDELPAYTVFIPHDPSETSNQSSVERRTIIDVILKRAADVDIEDDIDLDVEAVEARALDVLFNLPGVTTADLDGPEFTHSGEGSAVIVEAKISFSVSITTEIPTAS